MPEYTLNDDQYVTIRESKHGYYVAHATSTRTGETWHVVTRTSSIVGQAVSAAFQGEAVDSWDRRNTSGPWAIGHGKDAGATIARFERMEELWTMLLREKYSVESDEYYDTVAELDELARS